jgi:hypothetical protein
MRGRGLAGRVGSSERCGTRPCRWQW